MKDKIAIVLYALFNLLRKKLVTKQPQMGENIKVLVFLERPGIGDAILYLNGLFNLINDIKEQKIEYYLATSKEQGNFLLAIKSTFGMKLIELDLDERTRTSYKVFKNNVKKLSGQHWDYIMSFDKFGGYIKSLLCCMNHNYILAPEYFVNKKDSKINKLYDFLIDDYEKVYFEYKHLVMIHKAIVVKELVAINGFEDKFDYNQYNIPQLCRINNSHEIYCVISCGIAKSHNNQYRCWPVERYAKVIEWILNETNLLVYLCGSKDDLKNNSELYNLIKDNGRVINKTGKTNFAEWIETLRNAQFVLGNDSGYIHLANMLRTQAFVIAGYWNYGRFLPYERDNEDCCVPIPIYANKPECALCNILSRNNTNKLQCDKKVKEKGVYKCIDDVRVEDVIKVLKDNFMNSTREKVNNASN